VSILRDFSAPVKLEMARRSVPLMPCWFCSVLLVKL